MRLSQLFKLVAGAAVTFASIAWVVRGASSRAAYDLPILLPTLRTAEVAFIAGLILIPAGLLWLFGRQCLLSDKTVCENAFFVTVTVLVLAAVSGVGRGNPNMFVLRTSYVAALLLMACAVESISQGRLDSLPPVATCCPGLWLFLTGWGILSGV